MLTNMQNSRMTAGETAQRTLVIFRDCHKKNNLLLDCEDTYTEKFYRNYARRMGWLCTVRTKQVQPVVKPVETAWRKPSALAEMPRPKLFEAFNLYLTPLVKKGGTV